MIERVKLKRMRKLPSPPNRTYLTDANVRSLPAKRKQYLVHDAASPNKRGTNPARGLAVLVSKHGTKSFRCVFYFPGCGGKPHWMHLGRVGEITLDQARAAAINARRLAKQGEDPRAGDPTRSDAFKAVVEDYTKHVQIGERGNASAKETERVILNHTASWHARPIATIRAEEIERLLWQIRDGSEAGRLRARPYIANRLYAHLKHLFAWAARLSGPLNASPMTEIPKPWSKEKSRQRDWFKGKLGDGAIKAIWHTADKIGDGGRYVKMMILTGKRKTALASMRWEEIDDEWFWNAPPSQSKNKRLHGVPLPELAQRILHPRQSEGEVFKGISLDALLGRVREGSGISDFFWHGLRHLAETKTAELRDEDGKSLIPPHIRDLLFDHATTRGSGKGYDHHDYVPEMREAMEAWAGYVEGLVAAEGVAVLR